MLALFLLLTLFVSTGCFAAVAPLDPRRFNYFSFIFYLQFCVSCFVGIYLIDGGWRYDPIINFVSDDNKFQASLLILYAIATFSIFIFIFSKLLGRSARFFNEYACRPLLPSNEGVHRYFVWLLFVTILVALYFFSHIGNILFIDAFKDGFNAQETTKHRSEWVFELGALMQFIRLTITPLSQIIYFYFLIEWLTYKNLTRFTTLLPAFLLAVSCMLYGGDKAPIVFFLLGHFMLMVLLGKRISFRLACAYFVSAVVLITAIYFFLMSKQNEDTFTALLNRIFVSQVSGSYLSYQHFGTAEDFIGLSSQNASLIRLFDGVPALRASERLIEYYFPIPYKAGLWKNTNSLFIHEAWGNFGVIGALFAPIWCAFLISLNFFVLTSLGKSSFTLAFLAYASYATITLSGSFNSYLFSIQFLFLAFIFLLAYLSSRPQRTIVKSFDAVLDS